MTETHKLCRQHQIDLLVPTIDTELQVLAEAKAEFARLGTLVCVSGPETVSICRNKARTVQVLKDLGIPVPKTISLESFRRDPSPLRFPVILKPAGGSASIGIVILAKPSDPIPSVHLSNEPGEYIVQELWSGREYTVNMFFDSDHRLRTAVAHRRYEVRAGEVSKGITERNSVLANLAAQMQEALPNPFGALCFQAILKNSGEAAVFEINARFGGGYPLADRAGASFARWLLEIPAGLSSSAHNHWQENLTMLRYEAAVFIEGSKR